MRAYLVFDLPEDRNEFALANKGQDMFCCLWDFDQQLRSWLKYDVEFTSPDEALEKARERLHGILEEYGVNLDDFA